MIKNTSIQPSMDPGLFRSLAQDILKFAKKEGASQTEVHIAANKGFSVSVSQNEVETVEYHQDKIIEITVYFGKSKGSVIISDLRPASIQEAVVKASHIAKFTDEDPYAGLADLADLAFQYPVLELSFPWAITVPKAIDLACLCEEAALQYDPRIMRAEETSVVTTESLHFYANSLDFIGFFPSTHHEMSCVLVAKEGDEMQRNYSYSLVADPAQLKAPQAIGIEAAGRTVKRLGARPIATTKAPVIFFAEEARGLLKHFSSAIQGGNLYRESSFLLGCLGQSIFPSFVQIAEQPHLSRALGSAPFDNDGVATRPNQFIKNGVLEQYAFGSYDARKLNQRTTGNAGGMHNLTIHPGEKNLKALLKTMGTGLLITELMGQGVNLVTGDYSRGASGFWIKNGEVDHGVQEITVAGNLKNIFSNFVEVGNDVDVRGNIRTGSILIEEMMIAGC